MPSFRLISLLENTRHNDRLSSGEIFLNSGFSGIMAGADLSEPALNGLLITHALGHSLDFVSQFMIGNQIQSGFRQQLPALR